MYLKTANKFLTRIKPFIVNFATCLIVNDGPIEINSDLKNFDLLFQDNYEDLIHAHVRSNWSETPKWLRAFVFVRWYNDGGKFASTTVENSLSTEVKNIEEFK